MRFLPFAVCLALFSQAAAQPARPPVILITIDTLRADHLPMWGAKNVRTPHLEALSQRSVLFEQAVTPVPLTLPAHASLMTGSYPHFHQVRDNSASRLSDKLPSLATVLKERGYATGAFVASAVLDRRYGLDRGFDHYGDQFGLAARFSGQVAERPAQPVIDEAIEWMKPRRGEAFFAWIHLYDPHAPYSAPGEFASKGYSGEIEYADQQLGRLFEFLKGKGWDRKALIAVLSDHGEDLGEHGEPTHGFYIYDTVLRIPWLLKLPGDQYAGTRVTQQVRIIDVFPTLLQILQIPLSGQPSLQGRGLLSDIAGKGSREVEAYAESLYARTHFGWSSLFALRSGGYKFIEAPRPELYNLQTDPGETHNIFSSNQSLGNQMRQRLRELRSRYRGQDPAQQVEIDPAQRERLASLGYLSAAQPVNVPLEPEGLPDPKDKIGVYSLIYKGMQAFVEEEFEQSMQHLLQARQGDPSLPRVHDYLGRVLSRLNRPDEAVESYRQALQLAPGDLQASTNLAFAYLQAGQPKEAAQGLEMLTKLNPSDWQAWHFLGVSRTQTGDLRGAVEAFEKAVSSNPGQKDALFNLGTVYEGQQMHLKAVEVFRRLVRAAPEDSGAWNSLATNLDLSGLRDQADQAYQSALAADPDGAVSYFNYGNFYARQQDWRRAEGLYRQAVARDPQLGQAYLNLSVALEQQGKAQEASKMRAEAEKLLKER
ncbi:MAG: sulfatase-like hydrolase/transferase [Acidobacteriota bacterium]